VLRVGLTGGIASGKSTVAEMFVALGAALVDTDAIAREVVTPGSPALGDLREAFGPEIIAADGSLDRRRLRSRIFADEGERRRLEAILHPRIRRRALRLIERVEARYVLVAVPLLLETGFAELVDRIAVVDCPESVQVARLMARDGVTETEARAALDAQLDREARLSAADDVIDNGGGLEATRAQVRELHSRYLRLAEGLAEDGAG
jgi:dephospho-CoA kinase